MHLIFNNIFLILFYSFLSLYDRDGIDTIGLDDAAARLGLLPDNLFIDFISRFLNLIYN